MDPESVEKGISVNRAAYKVLRERIRRDHGGQYVALAEGRLVAVAPTYDQAVAAVEKLQPVPEFFFVFPADQEPAFEPYYSY